MIARIERDPPRLACCTAESRTTIARAAVGSCLYGGTTRRSAGKVVVWRGVGDQSLLHVLSGLNFFQQNYWLKHQINHTAFFLVVNDNLSKLSPI